MLKNLMYQYAMWVGGNLPQFCAMILAMFLTSMAFDWKPGGIIVLGIELFTITAVIMKSFRSEVI